MDKEIRQHNAITTARYEMSACEMDLIFLLLSKLKPKNGLTYQIDVKEIEEKTGRQWNYNQLQEATEKIGSRMYVIEDNEKLTQLWILGSAIYLKGEGKIELTISEKAKPYLIDLKNNFTSYKLYSALSLTSKYAKRIYQLTSQWKNVGKKEYTIEHLKTILKLKDPQGLEPEKFQSFNLFRKKVLEPAIAQINKQTDLYLSYDLTKKGRAFHSIIFSIKRTSKPLLIDFQDDEKIQKSLEVAKKLGITRKDILQEIAESEEVQKMLRKYVNDIKLGNFQDVKNKAGYFITMMKKQKEK